MTDNQPEPEAFDEEGGAEVFVFYVDAADAGERLDKIIVAQMPQLSRTQVQTLVKDGQVTVDDVLVKPGVKLLGGEVIELALPAEPPTDVLPEAIPLDVLYADDALLVVNKPAGMVVHPAAGVSGGTLVNALLHHYPEIAHMDSAEPGRQGIVHRLDKDTSGVIVVARADDAMQDLFTQFQNRTVDKTYLALLEREPKTPTGRIDVPIGRDPKQRKRMAVVRDGKPAVTEYRVLDSNFHGGQALVELKLLTGRTHQIRVHMAYIGAPVVGDQVYGYRKQRTKVKMKRNFLHAAAIAIDHPVTGERLNVAAPLPAGLQNIMDKLR